MGLSGVVGLSALLSGVVIDRVGPRQRDAGFAAFEVFTVVAAVTAAVLTAALSLVFLSRDEAISDTDLFRVSAPALVALLLLVVLTSVARFSILTDALSNNFPILLSALFAAMLAGAMPIFLVVKVSEIIVAVAAILTAGMVVGWFFLVLERRHLGEKRRDAQRRLSGLAADGYVPVKCSLRAAVPSTADQPEILDAVCWAREEGCYLDQAEARRLCRRVDARWAALGSGEAAPPLAKSVMTEARLKTTVWPWPPRFVMKLAIHLRGAIDAEHFELNVDERGLFDVTVLVFPANSIS